MRFTVLLLCLTLLACNQENQSPQVQCEAAGGTFRINEAANYFDEGACFKPTIDAGKACNDSTLCQSFCVGTDQHALTGTCYGETPFRGCAWVFNGGYLLEVCQE